MILKKSKLLGSAANSQPTRMSGLGCETQFWLSAMNLEVLAESGTSEHVICRLPGLSYPTFIPGSQSALKVPWFIYLQVLLTPAPH